MNNLKANLSLLDSKSFRYSNDNYRKSYKNLLNVSNNKYSDFVNSINNDKSPKNYHTGYMISNFDNKSIIYLCLIFFNNNFIN